MKEGQLTEDDSYVPPARAKEYSAFPVGDKKVFPSRRPKTGCWKLGLRQYDETAASSHNSVSLSAARTGGIYRGGGEVGSVESGGNNDDVGFDDASSQRSMGSLSTVSKAATGSIKAIGKLKRQISEDSLKLRPAGSAAKLNSYLHAQYATSELPKLTKDQKKN